MRLLRIFSLNTFFLIIQITSEGCFWPLTASITSEVKNDHNYVTTQRILNKLIEVNLSVGCVVWPWCCLFQPLTTSKTIRLFIQLVSCKCQTFWKGRKNLKLYLPRDLTFTKQMSNHVGDCFKFCGLLRKPELYWMKTRGFDSLKPGI